MSRAVGTVFPKVESQGSRTAAKHKTNNQRKIDNEVVNLLRTTGE
jgi:hypothetical protein